MSEASYLWSIALKRAIRHNRQDAHNRYLQLATIRRDGTPAVRSLVFREFCDRSMQLHMVTDRRSAKVDEIAANPAGEIGWYFSRSREQFRLRGTLVLTGADAMDQGVRRSIWDRLSPQAREQFHWPCPGADFEAEPSAAGEQPSAAGGQRSAARGEPSAAGRASSATEGEPFDSVEGASAARENPAEEGDAMPDPPDDFLLLSLIVTAVDHLTLRGDPQRRVLSTQDRQGVWRCRRVHP